MTITFKDNLTPDEVKKAAGVRADIDDTKNVRLGLYQSLYRIKNKGLEPEFIYLGVNWLRALDDLACAETGSYGERVATFCDVPVIEVVGHPYHFRVSIKEP